MARYIPAPPEMIAPPVSLQREEFNQDEFMQLLDDLEAVCPSHWPRLTAEIEASPVVEDAAQDEIPLMF